MNKILFIIVIIFLSTNIKAETNPQFIETFDLSVGNSHVCAITSLGIKCFGNAESVTTKTPTLGTNPRLLQTGNRFSCMIVNEGVKCWGEIPGTSRTEMLISKKKLPNPKLLAVGFAHACAVSSRNKIMCWGKNDFGETNAPYLYNVTEISLGMNSSCAITNGAVYCWGKRAGGSLNIPNDLRNPRNLTSGWWHHCVQTDYGIKCWGYPYNKSVAPDDNQIDKFTSGGFYNCAIIPTGVKCWDQTGKTTLVEDSIGAYKLSVGSTIACAVTPIKGVICWKLKLNGKSGYKLLKSFVPAGGITNIDLVSAGNASTCVYGDQGKLKCWGANPDGALDIPDIILDPISQLSLGTHKTCTISNSILNCWGDKNAAYNIPAELGNVLFVSSGGQQICAGTLDKIRCWGESFRGSLEIPKNLTNITQISSGLSHVCVVANDQVTCWGGEGLIKNVNPTEKMMYPRSLCAGGTFSCGIAANGETKCWGEKIQFGNPANQVLNIPKEIQNADVVEISCGLSHACAIYNGKIKCWGDDFMLTDILTAPPIVNPRNLTAGWNHTCALGDNGLSCWGHMLNMAMPTYSLEK